MVNERLCSRFASRLRRTNPKLASKLINKYSFDSGIDKRFLDTTDAVIGYTLKGLTFDQILSIAH